jgi:hypothetical protein
MLNLIVETIAKGGVLFSIEVVFPNPVNDFSDKDGEFQKKMYSWIVREDEKMNFIEIKAGGEQDYFRLLVCSKFPSCTSIPTFSLE